MQIVRCSLSACCAALLLLEGLAAAQVRQSQWSQPASQPGSVSMTDLTRLPDPRVVDEGAPSTARAQLAPPQPAAPQRQIFFPERAAQGYTIVLPGVMGETPFNSRLVKTLDTVPTTIEVHDWTLGNPLYRRSGLKGNRHNEREARKVAAKVVAYQDRHPGRPVYLMGLCAGAGVATRALEMLPPGRKVTSVIFLAPALSPRYNLQPALARTEQGIHSYHSPLDVPILVAFTAVFGTIDGRHGAAAGAIGFRQPRPAAAGGPQLHQHIYKPEMLGLGHPGGHFGWTAPKFVKQHLIPLLSADQQVGVASRGGPPR